MRYDDDETILNTPDGKGKPALLAPGARLGGYEVERHLGSGAMGDVYLARQMFLKQRCALKVLPESLSASRNFEQRFAQEGQALAMLDHPNIVRILYAGVDAGRHFLAMEYVEGGSLEDLVAKKGLRLGEDAVRKILSNILSGLFFAHGKNVVHRDLKPANILMAKNGRCKIADFGLALVAGEEYMQSIVQQSIAASQLAGYDAASTILTDKDGADKRSSDASALVGTIDYMSPEVRAGRHAGARSDIYAVGVMTYYMLTGRKPFGMAKPPSKIVSGLDPAWDEWVSTCMEFDPDERFQNVYEAKEFLPADVALPTPEPSGPVEDACVVPSFREAVEPRAATNRTTCENNANVENHPAKSILMQVYIWSVLVLGLGKLASCLIFPVGLGDFLLFAFLGIINWFVLVAFRACKRDASFNFDANTVACSIYGTILSLMAGVILLFFFGVCFLIGAALLNNLS